MTQATAERATQQQLLEQRNAAMTKCRDLVAGCEKDGDNNPIMSGEQLKSFNTWQSEFKTKDTELSDRKKAASAAAWLNESGGDEDDPASGRITNPSSHAGGDKNTKATVRIEKWNPVPKSKHTERIVKLRGTKASTAYHEAFCNAIGGMPKDKAFSKFKTEVYEPKSEEDLDAQAAGTMQSDIEEKGGYFVASEEFATEMLKYVDDATFVQRLARVFVIRKARSLGVFKRTAKVNSWNWGQELSDVTENLDQSLAYGKRALTPHYITGACRISRDLIRSSMRPITDMVMEEFSIDSGEKLEDAYLYGNGFQKPLGVMIPHREGIPTTRDVRVVSGDVKSGEVATNMFGFKTLIRAKYALKQRYRARARWMFHRERIADIAMITDNNGQFIWQPSKVVGDPDMALGLAIDESEWMPATEAADNYFGLLADWSYYWIAWALDMEIMVLDQIEARKNRIEYLGRMKLDGMPMLDEAFIRLQYAAS